MAVGPGLSQSTHILGHERACVPCACLEEITLPCSSVPRPTLVSQKFLGGVINATSPHPPRHGPPRKPGPGHAGI